MEESISNNRIKSSPSIHSEISVQSSVSHFTLCPKLPRCTLRQHQQQHNNNIKTEPKTKHTATLRPLGPTFCSALKYNLTRRRQYYLKLFSI